MTSYFEHFSLDVPDLAEFVADFQTLEEEYMPSGPPTSPLTRSFFRYFFLCDMPIAPGRETIASCYYQYVDSLDSNGGEMEVARQCLAAIRDSRMGVFLQTGVNPLTLREIGCLRDLTVHSTTGYRGEVGQLWFVRLLPPVRGKEHVVVTTPYRLFNATPQDWSSALARELMAYQRQGLQLSELLKYGTPTLSWPEFVHQSYFNHKADVIFLAGLPHVAGSRPHSEGRDLRPVYGKLQAVPMVELALTQAERRRVSDWMPRLYPAVGPEQRGTRLVSIPMPEANALLNIAAGAVLDNNGREHKYARGVWQALRQALPREKD